MEQCLILQRLIKFLVGLCQGNVQHGDEGLLDARCSFVESPSEVTASERCKDGREQGSVELADVRDRDSCRNPKRLIRHRIVNVEEESDDVEVGKGAASTDRLRRDILDSLAGVEADDFVLSSVEALDQHCHG